ncbi:MAG TPA: TetR/AcrR family transcriptional regulator [Solirubrobacteraceae bacterium]|jgi:AcrR family transcriptional regulator
MTSNNADAQLRRGKAQPAQRDTTALGTRRRSGAKPPRLRDTTSEDVTELQRARLILAAVDAADELTLDEVSVLQITTRAGVSRKTFYELFEDRNDCLLAAVQATVARISEAMLPAYRQQRGWAKQIRAGLAALLAFLDEHPAHGRLCVKAAFGGEPRLLAYRMQVTAPVAEALEAGRVKSAVAVTSLTAEALIGAVLSTLHKRLLSSQQESCSELLNPLMSMIALHFRGPAAARAELAAPSPKAGKPSVVAPTTNPLEGVQTRLTYRTLRVLRAIEDAPGSSNGTVAAAAGLGDLGQASKLLKRLQALELVDNIGQGAGGPNAWELTERGKRILATINTAAAPHATRRGPGSPA